MANPPVVGAYAPPAQSTLQQRIEAVRAVTELFRVERMVYLALTSGALLLLLASAGALVLRKGPDVAVLTALFGSSGLLTISIQRVLRMWDRALDLLQTPGGI